jgi:hypothetical protein
MKKFRKVLYAILVVLDIFLSLSALLGGIGLVAGLNAPPVDQLSGSIFKSFLVPGLALFVIVGGSALFSTILLFRRNKFAVLFANTAGIIIMFFEFVEVLVIGSPAGIARTLQIFYFGLGTLITVAAMGVWFLDLVSEPK